MRIFVFLVVALLAVAGGAFIAGYNWLYPDVSVIRWDATEEDCASSQNTFAWSTIPPSEASLDEEKLRTLTGRITAGEIENIHSVLIAHKEGLAWERYFSGEDWSWTTPLGEVQFDEKTLHDLRSVTKSIVSILFGVALDEGHIESLDTTILDALSGYRSKLGFDLSTRIEDITLRDALTMTAGLRWDELSYPYWHPRNDEAAMWRETDPVAYALTRPVEAAPGEVFSYNGGLPTVLAAILEASTGERLEDYARDRLFCPLGVDAFEWINHDPSGLPVAASGLRLTPRSMARIGRFMLNEGKWSDERLLSQEYVATSTSTLHETNTPIAPGYGYQWWVTPMETKLGSLEVPMAIGNGGQRIILLQQADIVLVITAGNYNSPTQGEPVKKVLEAVLDALDEPS